MHIYNHAKVQWVLTTVKMTICVNWKKKNDIQVWIEILLDLLDFYMVKLIQTRVIGF